MMDIDGIGEETAELLYACGLVKNIGDLYSLDEAKLSGLDRVGEKTAQRIMAGIEASKQVPFERVLYALSIPQRRGDHRQASCHGGIGHGASACHVA